MLLLLRIVLKERKESAPKSPFQRKSGSQGIKNVWCWTRAERVQWERLQYAREGFSVDFGGSLAGRGRAYIVAGGVKYVLYKS